MPIPLKAAIADSLATIVVLYKLYSVDCLAYMNRLRKEPSNYTIEELFPHVKQFNCLEITRPARSYRHEEEMTIRNDPKKSMVRDDGLFRYLLLGGTVAKQSHVSNSIERAVLAVCRLDRELVVVHEHIFSDDTLGSIQSLKVFTEWEEAEIGPAQLEKKERYIIPERPPELQKPTSSKSVDKSKVTPQTSKSTPPKAVSPPKQTTATSNLSPIGRNPQTSPGSTTKPASNLTQPGMQASSGEKAPLNTAKAGQQPTSQPTLTESVFVPLPVVTTQMPKTSGYVHFVAGCRRCLIVGALWLDVPAVLTLVKIPDVHSDVITDVAILRGVVYSVCPADKFVAVTKLLY